MLGKKKWFVWFAAFLLGLAAELFAPEVIVEAAPNVAHRVLMVAGGCPAKESDTGLKAISAEDVWSDVYRELMYGSEMTGQKLATMVLAEVKERDLELMSSSTDHIVTYNGRRFAITEEDYQVLLRIVEAESGGEDIKGRMLVANVILNRLEVGFGGDTVTEVVFAEGQFSPVASGKIFKVTPSEITIEAVERVLDGEDYSKGALYFMCRELASKKGIRWFDKNLKFLFKHGCHEFYTEKD